MSFQYSTSIRNGQLDQVQSIIGTAPKLYFFSGSEPANCAAADPSGLLATLNLPSSWMGAASAGSKAIAGGPWTGAFSAAGTAICFRIKDSTGTTCGIQGSVSITGGGGDMTLDNNAGAIGQAVSISTFTVTAANA